MNKYMEVLNTWNGELEDLCFELYSMLKQESENEQIFYFQMLCEMVGTIESNESRTLHKYFEKGDIGQLKEIYGKYVDETINAVRKKVICDKLEIEDFYRLLWNMVMKNSILNSDKEKAFGLLWILADNGIPYFEVGTPLSMENEEYGQIIDKNKKSIDRVKYILSIPFDQRTEVASLVLQEILKVEDYRVQTVILTQVMAIYAKKEAGNFKKLLNAIREMDE